jgi:small GTP-binding protein
VDRGIAARWSDTSLHLMPHGGAAVLRKLGRKLTEAGIASEALAAREVFPEATSLLEARMLHSLAEAASPLAVDVLLDQSRRWPAELHNVNAPAKLAGGEAPQVLGRLVRPPLVVALGPANVGKSSLMNALAGRGVAIVADEPGTTRDHIGVLIDMGGLVVRYIDTPGLREAAGEIEEEAVTLALEVAGRADLVLSCGDSENEPAVLDQLLQRGSRAGSPCHLRVALRVDLGEPLWEHDAGVSVKEGRGVTELVRMVREALTPQHALEDPRPWRFWEE